MKVTLIDSTHNPVEKLIFTKNTRLNMSADNFEKVMKMPHEDKMQELNYMVNTIKSSWEFVNYTFSIEGVSRAFTHQLVRNRQGSYAQQTMRILDVSGFDYVTGPTIENNENPAVAEAYHDLMATINATYQEFIELGVAIEDARGILPTNICTNIIAQYNLRTLSEIVASRSSPRTQGEYREVLNGMAEAILEVHPWADIFLRDNKVIAAQKLDSLIQSDYEGTEQYLHYIKLVDILRK
jgi:flavin-dependent thymidylate synthase